MLSLPVPRHMPCDECGASVPRHETGHACEEARRLEFALFQLRPEVALLDQELGRWLDSPQGRFERYYAERTRPD
jgi:hypothetical protein